MATKKPVQTPLGDFIDNYLKQEGISLAELARRLEKTERKGASASNLHRAYKGRINPGYEFYAALSQVTGQSIDKLAAINLPDKQPYAGRDLSSRAVLFAIQVDKLNDEFFHDLTNIAAMYLEKQKEKLK